MKALRIKVSTHSRPKAAGSETAINVLPEPGFNTQPPEGGWFGWPFRFGWYSSFNTQPPEGGWLIGVALNQMAILVSTHSRPKAAGRSAKRPV